MNNLIHTLFNNQSDDEYSSVVYSCHGLVDLYNLFFIYVPVLFNMPVFIFVTVVYVFLYMYTVWDKY